ncbi:hypothetical protein Tco_0800005 [Tanacetum coccineum]|uniref:DUF4283 domain-containing protein n=1 Tax=Tanacetum coccineum TaxID=301880 RepID=A0ABQ4ZV59_9ASTR
MGGGEGRVGRGGGGDRVGAWGVLGGLLVGWIGGGRYKGVGGLGGEWGGVGWGGVWCRSGLVGLGGNLSGVGRVAGEGSRRVWSWKVLGAGSEGWVSVGEWRGVEGWEIRRGRGEVKVGAWVGIGFGWREGLVGGASGGWGGVIGRRREVTGVGGSGGWVIAGKEGCEEVGGEGGAGDCGWLEGGGGAVAVGGLGVGAVGGWGRTEVVGALVEGGGGEEGVRERSAVRGGGVARGGVGVGLVGGGVGDGRDALGRLGLGGSGWGCVCGVGMESGELGWGGAWGWGSGEVDVGGDGLRLVAEEMEECGGGIGRWGGLGGGVSGVVSGGEGYWRSGAFGVGGWVGGGKDSGEGTVRFIRVENIDRLVGNLCTIWIGRLHLHANVVRFERPRKPYNSAGFKDTNVYDNAGSYVLAVKGNTPSNVPVSNPSSIPSLVLDDSCVSERDLSKHAMGRMKDLNSISNLRTLLTNEGFPEVKLSYLGGMWVMLELDNVDTKQKLLQHTGVNSWFQVLQDAVHDFVSDERVVWVDIKGILLNVWSRETFLKIGKIWGETMDIEDNLDSSFSRKRLCIKTKHADSILEKFKVIFRGKVFMVRPIHSDEDSGDDSDVDGVPDTIFGDNSSSLINCGGSESSPSLSHLPGFTPVVSEIHKEVDHVEVGIDSGVENESSPLVNAKVMNNSQEVQEESNGV